MVKAKASTLELQLHQAQDAGTNDARLLRKLGFTPHFIKSVLEAIDDRPMKDGGASLAYRSAFDKEVTTLLLRRDRYGFSNWVEADHPDDPEFQAEQEETDRLLHIQNLLTQALEEIEVISEEDSDHKFSKEIHRLAWKIFAQVQSDEMDS